MRLRFKHYPIEKHLSLNLIMTKILQNTNKSAFYVTAHNLILLIANNISILKERMKKINVSDIQTVFHYQDYFINWIISTIF